MARTQAADYEQRREAIVAKAADLFAERGFNGASVADLALACETSKSLIYHYFPSKEDILHEVMASHIDQLVEDIEDPPTAAGPIEALSAIVHRFMRHYVGAASRQKVLLNELGHLPPERRASIVGKQRRLIETVQRLLTAIEPALAADPAQARVKTMLLFGMINWTHTWLEPEGPLSVDRIADMVVSLASRPVVE
ncbi:MAG TPA: TetR/AcrR family transcriptional regulator [Sphingomonas sp.]|nr:TetR/AcrR family transcriptional regulator [Sphingomonas sp.]